MAQTLKHGAAEIIRQMLIDMAEVNTPTTAAPYPAWPAYAYSQPARPDAAVTIFDFDGTVHGRFMVDGDYGRHRGIQVMVRSPANDDRGGQAKADALATALARDVHNRHVTVEGVTYVVAAVSRIGQVIVVGQEPSTGRHLFSVNAEAAMRAA